MKWVLFLLLFAVIIAFFGLWYLQDPGLIVITWLGYEIQFSVVFGFVFLIILCFIIFVLLRLFYRIRSFFCYYLSFFKAKDKKENTPPLP